MAILTRESTQLVGPNISSTDEFSVEPKHCD